METKINLKQVTGYFNLLFLLAALFVIFSSMAPPNDSIIGIWKDVDGKITLEFYKVGNEFQAKLITSEDALEADGKTSKKDTKNPNPKLRNINLIGSVFITKLEYIDNEYVHGKIYASGNGGTYDCKVTTLGDKLFLRGYKKFEWLGKTITYNRVK